MKKRKYHKKRKKSLPTIIIMLIFGLGYFLTQKNENSGFLDRILRTKSKTNSIENVTNIEFSKCAYDSKILKKTYYTVGYNNNSKQANWVGYYLNKMRIQDGNESRSEDFREDESLPISARSTLADYRKSGFDRGHLAPAADFKFSAKAMSETFLLSNISPQYHEYNAGLWLTAEKVARKNAYEYGDIYIVTGPIFNNKESLTKIGNSKVWVPNAFYKVFLVYNDKYKKGIGFIIPHSKDKLKNLAYYAMSIDEVEKITDIDFFYNLPDEDEETIEKDFNTADWILREYQF